MLLPAPHGVVERAGSASKAGSAGSAGLLLGCSFVGCPQLCARLLGGMAMPKKLSSAELPAKANAASESAGGGSAARVKSKSSSADCLESGCARVKLASLSVCVLPKVLLFAIGCIIVHAARDSPDSPSVRRVPNHGLGWFSVVFFSKGSGLGFVMQHGAAWSATHCSACGRATRTP